MPRGVRAAVLRWMHSLPQSANKQQTPRLTRPPRRAPRRPGGLRGQQHAAVHVQQPGRVGVAHGRGLRAQQQGQGHRLCDHARVHRPVAVRVGGRHDAGPAGLSEVRAAPARRPRPLPVPPPPMPGAPAGRARCRASAKCCAMYSRLCAHGPCCCSACPCCPRARSLRPAPPRRKQGGRPRAGGRARPRVAACLPVQALPRAPAQARERGAQRRSRRQRSQADAQAAAEV